MTAQTHVRDDDPAWREIEDALSEIVSLSKSEIEFDELATELLERSVRMLAALGGAVWLTDANGILRPRASLDLESLGFSPDEPFHRRFLEQAIRDGSPRTLSAQSAFAGALPAEAVADYLLILHPLTVGERSVGLLQLIQRPTTNNARLRGNERLVSIVADAAASHLKSRRLSDMQRTEAQAHQFEHFAHRIHQSLDLQRVAFELANEGRLLTGWDRVSVAIRSHRGYRLLAVSGVDVLHRRSSLVRNLESLSARVAQMDEPLWYDGDTADLPQQIARELDAYVDHSNARTVAVVPMADVRASPPTPVGVLVAERFERITGAIHRERVQSVASQGALALKNALSYGNLPTLPLARRAVEARHILKSGYRGPLIVLSLALVLAIVLFAVPGNFEIGARGELKPRQRLEIFAPQDGRVVDVRVHHNDPISEGELLVALESTTVDLQLDEARGERDTTQSRLLSVESALLQYDPSNDHAQHGAEQLAAQKEELKLQLEAQQRQYELLLSQRQALQVRSPTKGHVLTWDVHRLLADRPVQRGQSLMTVADLNGEWVAELNVPDRRVGFLTDARSKRDEPLNVSFELATTPGVKYHGVVDEVAHRVELNKDNAPAVRVIVSFDRATIPQLRPGATILARVHCGRKPIGYVWLHDVYAAVREWMLL